MYLPKQTIELVAMNYSIVYKFSMNLWEFVGYCLPSSESHPAADTMGALETHWLSSLAPVDCSTPIRSIFND